MSGTIYLQPGQRLFSGTDDEIIAARLESALHLDQYFGLWSIAVERIQPLLSRWDHIQKIGLASHLRSPEAIAARESGELQQADREPFRRMSGAHELVEVSLTGTLMKHASSFDESSSTVRARREIRAATRADDVDGILIRIDSPGGTFSGTDDLAADVAAAAGVKPVFAYIEDLGASAAYYIASQATKVYSNRTAGVGSIGTFAVIHDLSQLAENEGIKVHVIKAGQFKGAGVPGTEVSDEHLAQLQKIVNDANAFFVSAVANGRKLTRQTVEALADGRIHIGTAAAELNLTDGIRSLDAAATELSAAARGRSRKGPKMTETKELESTLESTEPKAASAKELKTAFPKADAAFRLDCLERGLTLEDARAAYQENLEAQLDMRDGELEELKSQQPAPEKKTSGVNALGDDDASDTKTFANPLAEFNSLIDGKVEKGMPRSKATALVARENPDLRQAVIDEAN